jgi:hypothetical protein
VADTSAATLPLLVVAGLAVGGVNSAVTGLGSGQHLEALTASSRAAAGSTSAATLPMPLGSGGAASAVVPMLPAIIASGTAVSGVRTIAATIPLQIVDIQARGTTLTVVGSAAPMPQVTAQGVAQAGARADSGLSTYGVTAYGVAAANAVGTSAATMYGPVAQGIAATGVSSTSVIAVHTSTAAAWTYTNFPFNSFALFGGVALAAGDGGLFSLGGDVDNALDITAYARMNVTDFGTSYRKRIERVYVGYRALDDLILRVRLDGRGYRDYRIPGNLKSGIHGAHVRLGRGLEARYWQFEVRNQEGHAFSLDTIECKPVRLKRRIGGNDA